MSVVVQLGFFLIEKAICFVKDATCCSVLGFHFLRTLCSRDVVNEVTSF